MQTTTPNLAKWIIPVICLSGIITSLKAQILTDAFSYGSTPQAITALTSNWTAHSAAGLNSILYQTNSLPAPNGYPEQGGGAISFAGGSGSREDINRTITTQSSGTVYAAALVNIASTGTDYFFHYNIASFVGRVFSSNSSGNLRFGISKTGTATVSSTNFAFNTTYLMVVKYEFVNGSANDIVSLWILTEPKTSEAEAGTALSTDAGGTDPASLVCVCIRQGTSSATGILDELRIANSWEDAVGTIVWNGSSWSNGTPLARNNIKLNSNLNLNSNLSCNNICFANNSNLQIGSNQLTVNGNIYGNGNLASDYNSELIIGGNAGTLNFASGSRNLKNLTLNANASASLGTILNLAPGTGFGTLTLNSNSTLNTNGFLFLKSDKKR